MEGNAAVTAAVSRPRPFRCCIPPHHAAPRSPKEGRRPLHFPAFPAAILCLCALLSGCTLLRQDPTPGRTKLASPLVSIPARIVTNVLIVEVNPGRNETWRFLVDTGSSVTVVSPEFAERFGIAAPAATLPQVNVRSASGENATLRAVSVKRIILGDAQFDRVPALVYDFSGLSAHFGEKIDGVLGFPIFRQTILTLDYPHNRILLSPTGGAATLRPGSRIDFDTVTKTPLIPITLDGQTLVALIDSGSDGGLHLNTVGLKTTFTYGPVPGGIITTLTGERPQSIGRLAGTLRLGVYELKRPIIDLTDELSSIGGAILRNFVVSFDQVRGDVSFFRESSAPFTPPPQRSTGMSFNRTPAYWKVAAVIPGSPAESAGVTAGDLVIRIDGVPVSEWSLQRFETCVADAGSMDFTFLNGVVETTLAVRVYPLVP